MFKFILITLVALTTGCTAHRGTAGSTASRLSAPGTDNRLANLERAARLPWRDDGRCAVQEASGDWATLVERCYDALDRSRIRFVNDKSACPVAQAGAISADDVTRVVGICLLIQPEFAVGAVLVLGTVVVVAAIATEIEATRAKKPGCYCKCFNVNDGPYSQRRFDSPAACDAHCKRIGYTGSVCK